MFLKVDNMFKENIVSDLKEFGLSEYEAKSYLTLAVHGPLPASSVSELSKIPQSKIYEVLKSLVSKCLAEYWNAKPLRYKAVEPLFALKKMLNQKRMGIENLREKTSNLIKELKPFKENGFGSWSSKGKVACLEKAAEMISKAKKIGFATTSHFSRYPSLDEAYVKALRRGIKIKMLGISFLDEAKKARASWYYNQGANIRVLPLNLQTTLGIVDDKEVCIRIDNNSLDSDVIWSNNPAMVNIFKTYFKELWTRAKKFRGS
jgi:sugar-specific transcriptional regulator TrmB